MTEPGARSYGVGRARCRVDSGHDKHVNPANLLRKRVSKRLEDRTHLDRPCIDVETGRNASTAMFGSVCTMSTVFAVIGERRLVNSLEGMLAKQRRLPNLLRQITSTRHGCRLCKNYVNPSCVLLPGLRPGRAFPTLEKIGFHTGHIFLKSRY